MISLPLKNDMLVRGKFYDFAKSGKTLTPGGTYLAVLGTRRVTFQIDAQATTSPTPILGRMLRLNWAPATRTMRGLGEAGHHCSDRHRARHGRGVHLAALQTLQGLSLDVLTALRGELVTDTRDPPPRPSSSSPSTARPMTRLRSRDLRP